ncbi:MAG: hypothetical protein U0795_00920 [Pirellulales bacterium]
MPDPLKLWWSLVDASDPSISALELAAWPEELREWLFGAGLLVPAATASRVRCPECLDHIEDVVVRDYPDGTTRYYIACPEHLRVELTATQLQRWTVNVGELAHLLAAALALSGRPRELVPARIWRLGRTVWQGNVRDVLWALRLPLEPSTQVRSTIVQSRRPVVLVPYRLPPPDFWTGVPPLIALAEIADLQQGQLVIDPLAVAACLDATGTPATSDVVTPDELAVMIRRQVTAVHKSELSDQVFLSAYLQFHSLRKAAEYLTEQLGRGVSKDQVRRAVDRAGGAAALMRTEDSSSVVRGVASHSCDSARKIRDKSQNARRQ